MPKYAMDLLGTDRPALERARTRARANADSFWVERHERINPARLGKVYSKSVAWEKLEKAAKALARSLEFHPPEAKDKVRLRKLHQFMENAVYDKVVS